MCVDTYTLVYITINEIRGHQFEKEQGGKVEGLKGKKGKSEMM